MKAHSVVAELVEAMSRASTLDEITLAAEAATAKLTGGAEAEAQTLEIVRALSKFARDRQRVIGALRAELDDASERRREHDALRATEARLHETQRLEGLGVLAGGIAHDFNNLLVGILGNASMALAVLPRGPAHDLVLDIQSAARMAADLTRQLLAYSGKGRFVIEPLDLSRLVKDSADLVEAAISRKAIVAHSLAPSLPAVEGDATQLRQVTMNLIANASDALGDLPGKIDVSTGVVDLGGGRDPDAYPEGEVRAGRYAYIEVKDTGHGMEPAQIPRIFDPFYTTRFQGRGLGLAAVLGIVRGHGGAILVRSTPGVGTTFRLLLPTSAGKVVPPPASARTPPPVAPARDATVLIVDDEAVVRRVTERVLLRAGYKVLLAENGREALRIVEEHAAEISIVLLDLTMPELSGEETFIAIHALAPALPVVMTSGYAADTSTHLTKEGLAGFLEKPYTGADLLTALDRALAKARRP